VKSVASSIGSIAPVEIVIALLVNTIKLVSGWRNR
jgi:hypothetical protein